MKLPTLALIPYSLLLLATLIALPAPAQPNGLEIRRNRADSLISPQAQGQCRLTQAYIDSLFRQAEQHTDTGLLIDTHLQQATLNMASDNANEAFIGLNRALELAHRIADTTRIISTYLAIASDFLATGNPLASLTTYRQALDLGYEKMQYRHRIAIYNNLGNIYADQQYLDNAKEYYCRAYRLCIDSAISEHQAALLNNIALLELDLHRPVATLENALQGLKIAGEQRDTVMQSILHSTCAQAYHELNRADLAYRHAREALAHAQRVNLIPLLAEGCYILALVHESQEQIDSAQLYALRAIKLMQHGIQHSDHLASLRLMADIQQRLGNPERAIDYLKRYAAASDSMNQKRFISDFALNEFNREHLKMQNDNALHRFQVENQQLRARDNNRIILTSLGILLILSLASIHILRTRARQKQRSNQLLSQQSREMEEINRRLETHNRNLAQQQAEIDQNNLFLQQSANLLRQNARRIADGLKHIRNIQISLLPSATSVVQSMGNAFRIYAPRDSVSGDFYWFTSTPQAQLFALVDCAGHGIPGALMSIVGNILLNKIVKEWRIYDPATILQTLHEQILCHLRQDHADYQGHFSMDLSLIALNRERRELVFAGASSSIYVHQNGKINRYRGAIRSAGSILKEFAFTNHTIPLTQPTTLYLTSDGYIDQLNADNRKLGKQKFTHLLESVAHLPMHVQHDRLLQALKEHQGDTEQTDDICLIGIKIKLP